MLHLSNLSARIAGRLLIDDASLFLPAGTKAGLVGRNGAGKSTLFRIISGELAGETGSVHLPKGTRIGQVAQEAPGTQEPLIEIVLQADRERSSLLAEAENARDPHRIAEIQTRLADIGAHSAEARAAAILSGLGFDHAAQQRPAAHFSGGWRMRVALAAVLFAEPALLLLDEPTNYLDLEGTMWLEDYIRRYRHTVIIISHDRDLLNNAVNAIIHLDRKKLTFYRGSFDQFRRQKLEADILQTKARARNEAARKHMEAFVERFRYKASKARQAQSRLKALQKMGTIDAVVNEQTSGFVFAAPKRQPASPILVFENTSVGYEPGKPILASLNLRFDRDDRIALLGANGNGKSTLAKLIAGRLSHDAGQVTRAPGLKIGYFAQHQLDDLIPEASALDHVRRLMPDAPEANLRARVAGMGLATDKMDTAARNLSGGEKARLLMGLATFDGPHLLILDEPTNHLDIDSRQALVKALNDFPGAVLLISHDRHLIEATVERLWLVRQGTVDVFDGDLDDYRALIVNARREPGGQDQAVFDNEPDGPVRSKADQRKQAAGKRAALAPLKKKINEIESLSARLEKLIRTLDAELADPALYTKTPDLAGRKARERAEAQKELAQAEEEWLTLSAQYEEAMAQ